MHHILIAVSMLFISISTVAQQKTSDGLYFNTFGHSKNPSIVFLHGGPGYNSFSFEFGVAQALAEQGYFVVVFDQRGCGRSSAGQLTDLTFPWATKDIASIIQASHAVRPLLIGHSWGGTLGVQFLKIYPGVARGLVLVDAPINWPATMHSMLTNMNQSFQQIGDLQAANFASQMMSQMFPVGASGPFLFTLDQISTTFFGAIKAGLYYPKAPSSDAKKTWLQLGSRADSHLLKDGRAEPVKGFFDNENLYYRDFNADLERNSGIIFALFGDEDRLFDPSQLNALSSALPAGHFALLRNAGHYSFIDQRSDFIRAIATFSNSAK